MKTFIIFFLSLSFASKDISINVITTNDLHGSIAPQKAWFMNPNFAPDIIGGAGLIKYVEDIEEYSESEILIFDGGNFFQGHPYGMNDGGMNVIKWMNNIDYTALVPGANDFILGQKNLNKLADSANFPFLMTNLICDDCELKSNNIKPYLIKQINTKYGNIKIGIIGIVNSGVNDLTVSANVEGITFKNAVSTLDEWIPRLKEKEVNSIIVLTSSGVPWDRDEKYREFNDKVDKGLIDPYNTNLSSIELGRFAEDVDIIVSGGFSKGYDTPWYDPYSHTYIFQNYGNGTSFGHFEINFDSELKSFRGYKSMVDGKIAQTLLNDDFDADFKDLELIIQNNDIAIQKLYSSLDPSNPDQNQFSNIKQKKKNYNQWDIPVLGTDSNLEVMTWNCEFFPAAGDSTIKAMSEIINDLNIDVIAFQEIKKAAWFEKLVQTLPDYEYVISKNSSFFDQAYIFKKDLFSFIRDVEPFSDNDYNFAGRPPLRLDLLLTYNNLNIPISFLNLHMKCCDSGLKRRKKASQMLYDYLEKEIDDSYHNFIVLGDWNDDLRDKEGEHCFQPFMLDEKYYFLTDRIDDIPENATYPKEPYVSFLDHIMTTNDFIDLESPNVHVETLMIEDYIGGYNIYELLLSDHRAVMFSIPFADLPK